MFLMETSIDYYKDMAFAKSGIMIENLLKILPRIDNLYKKIISFSNFFSLYILF
jgi:hypothetical protein